MNLLEGGKGGEGRVGREGGEGRGGEGRGGDITIITGGITIVIVCITIIVTIFVCFCYHSNDKFASHLYLLESQLKQLAKHL